MAHTPRLTMSSCASPQLSHTSCVKHTNLQLPRAATVLTRCLQMHPPPQSGLQRSFPRPGSPLLPFWRVDLRREINLLAVPVPATTCTEHNRTDARTFLWVPCATLSCSSSWKPGGCGVHPNTRRPDGLKLSAAALGQLFKIRPRRTASWVPYKRIQNSMHAANGDAGEYCGRTTFGTSVPAAAAPAVGL
jgi:hypothetical protein